MTTKTTKTTKRKPTTDEYIYMKNLSGQEVRVRNTKENIDILKSLGWKK